MWLVCVSARIPFRLSVVGAWLCTFAVLACKIDPRSPTMQPNYSWDGASGRGEMTALHDQRVHRGSARERGRAISPYSRVQYYY